MSFQFLTGDTLELHLEIGAEKQVFRTLVDQVASDRLFVIYTPLAQGKVLLTSEGQQFEVVFSRMDRATGSYDIYSFQAKLNKRITKDGISMWQIERISDFSKLQRRDYYRLNIVRLMSVNLDQRDQLKVEVLTKDISAGGMRCVASQRLNPGEPVTCNLLLDIKKPMILQGEVVSSDLMADSSIKYDVRIRFSGISRKQEIELNRQINVVQAEYLKKNSATSLASAMDSVMAHIDLKKAEERIINEKFDIKLGYWMALDLLLILLMGILYFASRPTMEFPVERFNDIISRTGWNQQILFGNMGISAMILIVSFVGILIDRHHYSGKRPINLTFVIGSFIGLLSLMVLTTLFATVFNVSS